MNNPPNPPAREPLGFLLEFFNDEGYLGNLHSEHAPGPIGQLEKIVLDKDLEVKVSFTRKRTLKAGMRVDRLVQRLEGRAVTYPKGRW